MDPGWLVLGMLLLIPAFLAACLVKVVVQNLRTLGWSRTTGRIISSAATARTIRSREHTTSGISGETGITFVTDETLATKNFAAITYDYVVDGTRFQCDRVQPDRDFGNFGTVALVRRYPAGKLVDVFYDPADPSQAILERDDPKMIAAAGAAVAALTLVALGLFFGGRPAVALLAVRLPHPERMPLVVFLLVVALFLLLMALGFARRTRRIRRWPTAMGSVTTAAVVETTRTRSRPRSGARSRIPIYVPRVIYRYVVDGVSLQGDRLGHSARGSARRFAEATVARYPAGRTVAVRYDPDDPTDAVVDPAGYGLSVGATAAAVMAAGIALALGWW